MGEISQSIEQGQKQQSAAIKQIKVVIFGVAAMALQITAFWLLQSALFDGKFIGFWAYYLLCQIFAISFMLLFFLVNRLEPLNYLVSAALAVGYWVMFPKDIYVAAGGMGFLILSIFYFRKVRHEEKDHLHFSLRRIANSGIQIITYALLIIIGFGLYYDSASDFKKNPQKYYDNIVEAVGKSVPLVSGGLGGKYNLNQTLDDYLLSTSKTYTEDSLGETVRLNDEERINYISEYRTQFLKQFGIDAQGNETLAQVILKIVDEKADDLFGKYGKYFPAIYAVVIVMLLRAVSFVFNLLAIFFSWVVYKLFLAFGFLRIGKRTVEVDQLEV
jgi:hypothetical protein